jgi:uridine monophosphate synthetase
MNMNTFFAKLETRIRNVDSLLCIGLDPHPEDLSELTGTAALAHCVSLFEATQDIAAAYKPNIAFFEVLGPDGIVALQNIIKLIPDEIPVILDAKRGDIASTADAYAQAIFKSYGADAVTVNPYLGKDSINPFISNPENGVFLLCKTSNPGASDLQDLPIGVASDQNASDISPAINPPLFLHVAHLAQKWNINNNLGLVVGATQAESLIEVRTVAPDLWILAPGVGAQGGDLRSALNAGLREDGLGMLIPVSRGISRAVNPREAAKSIQNRINRERGLHRDSRPERSGPSLRKIHAEIADQLLDAGCIKFGTFTLKSGIVSPIYIDLRRLVGYPKILTNVAEAYAKILQNLQFDQLAALPYAAMPIASAISLQLACPMVYPRKEVKAYGTKAQVEGVYKPGQKVVVIDDLISTGGSKLEGIEKLESAGLKVEDIVVLIDRSLDGGSALFAHGYTLHAVLSIDDLLDDYERKGKIGSETVSDTRKFLSGLAKKRPD